MGLDYGRTYLLSNAKKQGGNITFARKVDVYDSATKSLLQNCDTLLEAVIFSGIAATTITRNCKKNKNKYMDEWIPTKNFIFIYGEPNLF